MTKGQKEKDTHAHFHPETDKCIHCDSNVRRKSVDQRRHHLIYKCPLILHDDRMKIIQLERANLHKKLADLDDRERSSQQMTDGPLITHHSTSASTRQMSVPQLTPYPKSA